MTEPKIASDTEPWLMAQPCSISIDSHPDPETRVAPCTSWHLLVANFYWLKLWTLLVRCTCLIYLFTFLGGPAVKSGGGLAAWTRCPSLTRSSVSFSAGSPSLGGGEFPSCSSLDSTCGLFYFCWAMRGFQRVPSYRAVLQDCCSPRAPSYWALPGARRGRDGSAEPH